MCSKWDWFNQIISRCCMYRVRDHDHETEICSPYSLYKLTKFSNPQMCSHDRSNILNEMASHLLWKHKDTSHFWLHCLSSFTHVSVQNSSSAVEVEPLSCWFQYHPVFIVVQQRQWDGPAWVLGTAIYLHVFHQNCTCEGREVPIQFMALLKEDFLFWQNVKKKRLVVENKWCIKCYFQ